jgi:hypothetical protein
MAAAAATAVFATLAVSDAALAAKPVAKPVVLDADRDGMPDAWEVSNKLDPRRNDARLDPDRDGLTNLQEYLTRTSPKVADTNRNGVSDGNEDPDKDRLTNRQEFVVDDNPLSPDTDKDGIKDGNEDTDHDGLTDEQEFRFGDDPKDADSDDDGKPDGSEKAGTIAGYDAETGVLTVTRSDSSTLTVAVTADTEIKWRSLRHGSGQSGQKGQSGTGGKGGSACSGDATVADLTVGRVVSEIELAGDSASPVADEIKLACG